MNVAADGKIVDRKTKLAAKFPSNSGEKMRLNTDVLSKLRVRKAKGGDEPFAKKIKPRLTRKSKESDPLTFVDSGIVCTRSTPSIEQKTADKVEASPKNQGNDVEILESEARVDTKGKTIEDPSILRDPHDALNKLTDFPFVADMKLVDKMSNKELSEKNLVATSQAAVYAYAVSTRLLRNLNYSRGLEDMYKKATAEREDMVLMLDRAQTKIRMYEEQLVNKMSLLKTCVEQSVARDKEIRELKQEIVRMRESVTEEKDKAVAAYKESQSFVDSMTVYFFEGFEAFRRRATSEYPDKDFKKFEADDYLASLISEGQATEEELFNDTNTGNLLATDEDDKKTEEEKAE
ncbi:hypothetical protein RHGRI_025568 [Rhododendron griersonianum]|uniref:Uncharacterized protein n=1 Tax=Rhododendron griersonianum TaxID=479676 RepID=A0AAV6IQW3_9ERIC|nr:hypothetical protein RHGRI_025568 [Rhododendron griersonianum]